MFLKIFIFLLPLLKAGISGTDICVSQTSCRCDIGPGQAIDLSTVGSSKSPRTYEFPVRLDDNPNSTNIALYSYNPCFPFNSGDPFATVQKGNARCLNAAACVRTVTEDGNPEEHAIGLQSTAKFQASGDKKYITYTVPGFNQNLTVFLNCDNSTLYNLTIDQHETPLNSSVVMTLNSKCVCLPNTCAAFNPDDPPASGLSTGSKLLIAFFTIMIAYFLIGIVWNFCNGATGVELIPNLDFWNDIPKLIIEGIAFTCSFCGRKSSYGEV